MYKTKACFECEMPGKAKLNVLVLNGSLKHKKELSNTEELCQLVIKNMKKYADINFNIIRLADKNLPVGLNFRESKEDEWPKITKEIKKADVIIFATPIWWGNHTSLLQRVIERFDAFDEEFLISGQSIIYNKIGGIVITGNEDGALATMGRIMIALTWFGFTLPPECCAYWVGEVGFPEKERERRLKNEATKTMAKNLARNLVYYSQLMKKNPLKPSE